MHRLAALSVVVALASSACASAPSNVAAVASASDEPAIVKVLDDFHLAASQADEARYFGHLAEEAVFLGTDATERWNKAEFLAYAHPHFAKGKAWSFQTKRRVISQRGDLAYFDEDLETEGLGPARGSGVLVRSGSGWKILQYNLTITVPNDRFDLVKEAAGGSEVVTPAADTSFAQVAWLAGAWVGQSASGLSFEEVWTVPNETGLIGMSRASRDGKMEFSERLQLKRQEGKLLYIAHPSGQAETVFTATREDSGALTFENPAHDYPKRIRYERVARTLVVTIDDGAGQKAETFTLRPAVVRRAPSKPNAAR